MSFCNYCENGYIRAWKINLDPEKDESGKYKENQPLYFISPIGYEFSCPFCPAGKWDNKQGLPIWGTEKYGKYYKAEYTFKRGGAKSILPKMEYYK